MEPSGRNHWQPVAKRTAPKTAQTSESRCRGSPSEGFVLLPAHRTFLCQSRRAFAPSTSTQRPPASTGRMQVQRSAAAALIDRPYGTFRDGHEHAIMVKPAPWNGRVALRKEFVGAGARFLNVQ
jgi:hypothetical protein